MDRDDYLLIGYITLWRVLEKCREKPDIINSFNAYLFSSVRNAYAAEFRKYVMKNPLIRVRYEEPGGSYNISSAFFLADNYLKKDREKAKRYYHNHIDEIKARKKEYRKHHRAELTEKNREYRKANKDKVVGIMFDFEDEEVEKDKTKIVKRKAIELKPMSEEEAILQMNLIDHTFFLFRNSKNGEVEVIYKRKDGNYGLIKEK